MSEKKYILAFKYSIDDGDYDIIDEILTKEEVIEKVNYYNDGVMKETGVLNICVSEVNFREKELLIDDGEVITLGDIQEVL